MAFHLHNNLENSKVSLQRFQNYRKLYNRPLLHPLEREEQDLFAFKTEKESLDLITILDLDWTGLALMFIFPDLHSQKPFFAGFMKALPIKADRLALTFGRRHFSFSPGKAASCDAIFLFDYELILNQFERGRTNKESTNLELYAFTSTKVFLKSSLFQFLWQSSFDFTTQVFYVEKIIVCELTELFFRDEEDAFEYIRRLFLSDDIPAEGSLLSNFEIDVLSTKFNAYVNKMLVKFTPEQLFLLWGDCNVKTSMKNQLFAVLARTISETKKFSEMTEVERFFICLWLPLEVGALDFFVEPAGTVRVDQMDLLYSIFNAAINKSKLCPSSWGQLLSKVSSTITLSTVLLFQRNVASCTEVYSALLKKASMEISVKINAVEEAQKYLIIIYQDNFYSRNLSRLLEEFKSELPKNEKVIIRENKLELLENEKVINRERMHSSKKLKNKRKKFSFIPKFRSKP